MDWKHEQGNTDINRNSFPSEPSGSANAMDVVLSITEGNNESKKQDVKECLRRKIIINDQ